jgi:hypothetical protein
MQINNIIYYQNYNFNLKIYRIFANNSYNVFISLSKKSLEMALTKQSVILKEINVFDFKFNGR